LGGRARLTVCVLADVEFGNGLDALEWVGAAFSIVKLLLLVLVLAVGMARASATDILANGDFANGSAHWDGDRVTDTDATNLVITLKHDTWTKISQVFHSADSALKVHVSYTLSEDCTFLPQNGMAGFSLTDGVIKDITGQQIANIGMSPIPMGGFLSVIVDLTKPLVFSSILGGKVNTDTQTASGFFYDLNPNEEKTFYLAFPPGKGTVTLTGIVLESAPQGPTKD
jgi:hypothetical protein